MLFLLVIANLTIRPFHPPQPRRVTVSQLLKPITEKEFVLLTLGFFLLTYGFFIPIDYLPAQALSTGMNPNLVQYLLPILNAGSLFGRLFSGFLGDKIGRYNVFVIACYLSGIWVLAIWLPAGSEAASIAFAALFGCFSGAYISLLTPMVMQISPMSEIGFRTGIIMLVGAIAGLTTNPINGAILESASGSLGLKVFSGVFFMAGTSLVLAARTCQTGWKLLARC